jgi:hypothetical protein
MNATVDYKALLERVEHGHFCDTGHYYCPSVAEDGTITFPSGGKVKADGSFKGPPALLEQINREIGSVLITDWGVGAFGKRSCGCPAVCLKSD